VPWVGDPLLIPAGLWFSWCLVSALASGVVGEAVGQLGDIFTLLLIPMILSLMTVVRWHRLVVALAVTSSLSSIAALIQIARVGGPLLEARIHGLHSHYMTYAGWTLAVTLVLVGDLLVARDSGRWRWQAPVVALHVLALLLSLTRNAWVGLAAALALATMLWRPKALLAAPLAAVVAIAVLPGAVRERVVSIADLEQHANRDRLAMARAGLAMIGDHPLTGVGPGQVKRTYPAYRTEDAVRERVSHLHNNPMMIAAELGLPAVAIWAAFLGVFALGITRDLKRTDHPAIQVPAGCALAVTGLTAAGFFEYNWGDSEIWMLTVVLLAAPAAIRREPS
jgi:putative inorganic carbon (HCO3(-)) transporter